MRNAAFTALILLVVSLGFGIWTAIAGLPYRTALFTVHKLTSVALAVLCILFYLKVMRVAGVTSLDLWMVFIFSASLILLLVTGAMLGARQAPAGVQRIVHGISAVSLSLSTGWELIAFLLG